MTNSSPFPEAGLGDSLRRDAKLLTRRCESAAARWAMLLTNRGMHAVVLYRLSHALWKAGVPVMPLLMTRVAQTLFAVDIAYQANIGPGLVIVHGIGTVIGNTVVIEGDCCIFHGVTLGNRGSEWVGSDHPDGQPVVERNCMFGAGAKILGPVRIGANSMIGANAVVLKDVAPSSIMAGVPAKLVGHRPLMDENLQVIAPFPPGDAFTATSNESPRSE